MKNSKYTPVKNVHFSELKSGDLVADVLEKNLKFYVEIAVFKFSHIENDILFFKLMENSHANYDDAGGFVRIQTDNKTSKYNYFNNWTLLELNGNSNGRVVTHDETTNGVSGKEKDWLEAYNDLSNIVKTNN